jgi:hypothetical protein
MRPRGSSLSFLRARYDRRCSIAPIGFWQFAHIVAKYERYLDTSETELIT